MTSILHGDRFAVGPHLFACGDLLIPGEWESLVRLWRNRSKITHSWVYSDPPWNDGNLRYWRTMAGYESCKQNYSRFCERFAECVAMVGPEAVYVETGFNDTRTMVLAASREAVWPNLAGRWEVLYGSPRRPNCLLRFAGHAWDGDPSGMSGEAMTDHVFSREPSVAQGLTVVDPCLGLGMTARMAHKYGLPCVGNELNPKRLARVLAWFAKKGMDAVRL